MFVKHDQRFDWSWLKYLRNHALLIRKYWLKGVIQNVLLLLMKYRLERRAVDYVFENNFFVNNVVNAEI